MKTTDSTQTAHTPRPWKVDGSDVLGYHRDNDGAYFTVAKVSTPYGSATLDANARLIAAAPELLALAQHISVMADDAYLTGHPEWQAIVEEAQAIQKRVSV